jgi:hypothetical protein
MTVNKYRDNIRLAAESLSLRLKSLKGGELPLSALGLHQFNDAIINPDSRLWVYCDIIERIQRLVNKPIGDIKVVDYGGGLGLLSLLCREYGFAEISYVDIHEPSVRDAEIVATQLGLAADRYISGGAEQLVEAFSKLQITCDVVASFDVVEHVFDLDALFNTLFKVPGEQIYLVMGTGANVHNPRLRRIERAKHAVAEKCDVPKKWGSEQRDANISYLKARYRIIRNYSPELLDKDVDFIANITRGLIEPQIVACVDEYRRTGAIGYRSDDPTNTCCPVTGYWAEHLVPVEKYLEYLSKAGFVGRIHGGPYNPYGRWSSMRLFVNALINIFGDTSRFISPSLIIEAVGRKSPTSFEPSGWTHG